MKRMGEWFRLFGYVKISKPRLTCGDFERYQGVYCSLCKTLGRRYGPFARFALNYDTTFYAMLALSVHADELEFSPGRCSFNPTKKCLNCRHAALDFAADAGILMAYYKWRDKLEDSSFGMRLLWSLLGLFFLWAGRKAKRRAPEAERIIRTAVTAQRMVETGNGAPPGIDASAHPSAHALGALCAVLNEEWYRLGYLLGRWVYLMDAADDLAEDEKHGQFNPFFGADSDPWECVAATEAELRNCWAEVGGTEEFPVFYPVLDNIFTLGLAQTHAAVRERAAKKTSKA